MDFVIFDLEWNSGYSKKQKGFINEIIELGAVKLNEEMQITGQFSIFIRPEITRRLNATVRELTHLTNEDLMHGATFPYAVSKFRKFSEKCVILSWSTSDLDALEANCTYYFGSQTIPFLKQYADAQAYCQSVMGKQEKNQLSLSHAAQLLSVSTEDIPLHRAVGDSILTARILQKIYDPRRFADFIRPVDEEFYARLNFHPVFLCRPDHPLIDREQMFFDCRSCGTRCLQQEDWKIRNKAFYTVFECPRCQETFRGRIQFKLCYDGVVIQKRILAEPPSQEPEALPEEMTE